MAKQNLDTTNYATRPREQLVYTEGDLRRYTDSPTISCDVCEHLEKILPNIRQINHIFLKNSIKCIEKQMSKDIYCLTP